MMSSSVCSGTHHRVVTAMELFATPEARSALAAASFRARSGGTHLLPIGAVTADAEDLDGVADIGEAVLAGHLCGPRLDVTTLDFDRRATRAADQVVMVIVRAAAVHRLAGVGAQRVDQPVGGHRLQRAVHGRQTDALAAAPQFVVEFLRGSEVVEVFQQRRDRGALAGGPHSGGAHWLPSAACVTAATTISAR